MRLIHSVSQFKSPVSISSILPGHLIEGKVTAVRRDGLNIKFGAFYEGTVDILNIPLDKRDTYEVGMTLKARVMYDSTHTNPKSFACSLLPHILSYSTADSSLDLCPIGTQIDNAKVVHTEPDWGLETLFSVNTGKSKDKSDTIRGFVHVCLLVKRLH